MRQASGPVQSTYDQYTPIGQVGTPATEHGWDVDSRICEEANGIGFGLVVCQGDADKGALLGVTSGRDVIGISRASVSTYADNPDKYSENDNMAVAVRGDWYVVAEAAVNVGDAVLYDPTNGKLGHTGGTTLNGARWMSSAGAGGIAIVRLGGIVS
jgi:hypothetical protein